jgi:uncharacterized repeat protein (TIGR03803 family)
MTRHFQHALLAAAVIGGLIAPALAQQETALYAFPSYGAGYFPRGGLGMDSSGNLYGTTYYGGMYQGEACSNCGTIYKLTPPAGGQTAWTYQLLHTFTVAPIQGYTEDGIDPISPLVNFNNVFYGTTNGGGDTQCGCGTVFSITPGGTYTILHVFDPFVPGQPADQWPLGTTPVGGLLISSNGTIYGTTNSGGDGQPGPDGSQGAGIIFQMSTSGAGFSKLHDFNGSLNAGPQGMMIFGQDGAIYGTQFGGGLYNQGLIFRMDTSGNFTDIYDFLGTNQPGNSHDGANPEGRLALGPDGTIYGTTTFGGSPSGYGTAWSIKEVNGSWVYTQLYIFGSGSAGSLPHSGLIYGQDGALYGTGAGGGLYGGGVVYRLAPSGGQWTYETLYNFYPRTTTGDTPYGDLLYANGKLYGVNLNGGNVSGCPDAPGGCGNVFELNPRSATHDFNGEGMSDILWRNTTSNLAVWLMNGSAVLQSAALPTVTSAFSIIGQHDFNGDGKADLLWRDTSGNISMWFMNGAAIASAAAVSAVTSNWTLYGTGDLNGDGKGDLLWRDANTGDVAIWFMNGSQVAGTGSLGTVPNTWTILGDANGGILWRDSSSDIALWGVQNGQVTSSSALGTVTSNFVVQGVGDFNGDGHIDILWRETSTGTLSIWFTNGTQVTSAAVVGTLPTTWNVAQIGDYNGDGYSDILLLDTSGDLAVWLMNGSTVATSAAVSKLGTTWTVQNLNDN